MFQKSPEFNSKKTVVAISILVAGMLLNACSSSDDDEPEDLQINPGSENISMPSPTIDLVPQELTVPAVGVIYTDDAGLALYTRFTDEPDVVSCNAECLQQWPALTTTVTSTGISGNFDVIARDENTSQWTLLGYPLHRFAGDAATGEVNGDGVDDEWALARPIPVTSAEVNGDEALVALGSTLSNDNGDTRVERDNFTLYIFANDTDGVSNCNGGCATNWLPLYADTGAVADGDRYSLITREDGSVQWAYQGMALYYWQGDNAAGDFTGAQIENWSIATP
ncbi:MAG: hypothetical protein AB8B97_21035 [Granulosicoccus sp.]